MIVIKHHVFDTIKEAHETAVQKGLYVTRLAYLSRTWSFKVLDDEGKEYEYHTFNV